MAIGGFSTLQQFFSPYKVFSASMALPLLHVSNFKYLINLAPWTRMNLYLISYRPAAVPIMAVTTRSLRSGLRASNRICCVT